MKWTGFIWPVIGISVESHENSNAASGALKDE
jgi:hypothetical protein